MTPPHERFGRPANWPTILAPAGRYAVEDPAERGRWTAWRITDDGDIHRFPPSTRWEPAYPDLGYIEDRETRSEVRNAWYATVYWPWKVKIVEVINANPELAAARFERLYASVIAAEQAREAAVAERRRFEERYRRWEEIRAGQLARLGSSVREIARQLGVARRTADARIAAGSAAWAENPSACEEFMREVAVEIQRDRVDHP